MFSSHPPFSRLLEALFCSSLTLCWSLGQPSALSEPTKAVESVDHTHLVQKGLEYYQTGELVAAIAAWQTALNAIPGATSEDSIAIQRYLIRAYQQVGQTDSAITLLQQLVVHYRQVGNLTQVGRMLTELAQIYSSLGQHQRAVTLLCGKPAIIAKEQQRETESKQSTCNSNSAMAIAQQQSDREGEAAALGSLGNSYRSQGEYAAALHYLSNSLLIADRLNLPTYQIAALTNLGNTYTSLAKQDYRRLKYAEQASDSVAAERFQQRAIFASQQATDAFQRSLSLSQTQHDSINEVRSLLNLATLFRKHFAKSNGSYPQVADLLQQAQQKLTYFPPSRDKVYAILRLTSLLNEQKAHLPASDTSNCPTSVTPDRIKLLEQAVLIAQQIQDPIATSLAIGALGQLHECHHDYDRALALTQQAQLVAQMPEIRYRWEWQMGRILYAQGKIKEAIDSYQAAVKTLNVLRGDLAIANRDFQFDFRDTVEPVYRELAELQLEQVINNSGETGRWGDILQTIDDLRLSELQNYLGSDCTLQLISKPITVVDTKTAVFSTIILRDRVAIILTLPDSKGGVRLKAQWLPESAQEILQTTNQLRLKLEQRSDLTNTYRESAKRMYDWLIRPFIKELETAQVETLIFIQDGVLRSLPMAALHDGQQFLVEQYAIANTPSLTLIDPTRLDNRKLRVLAFGLTQPSVVEGPAFFDPLSQVQQEIQSILMSLPGSRGFLNGEFTPSRLEQELRQTPYPVLHLATHGKFGFDSRETFLVTGKIPDTETPKKREINPVSSVASAQRNSYNQKLTMQALYQIIQNLPLGNTLELLTLTACETAVGSDRDALGIAGISLQAGARSAIASIWQVDDESTAKLIAEFYQNLQQGMSRAKALQMAQRNWLRKNPGERSHPGYWAAMILVGNWL